MRDIIGNTICADLLDYLPRDRTYLGMEARHHTRLQRYFTIQPGTLYPGEGLRLSIMVTRGAHGGQRRDVATAVLDIMRERYEMAERVYYHHKKAAASAMLAKLFELTPDALRPRDDERIYPAPWDTAGTCLESPPHMIHLSDVGLIEYLGHVKVAAEHEPLQRRLYSAIVSRRRSIYRTLLVIDYKLASDGLSTLDSIVTELRGAKDKPDSTSRQRLEVALATAANSTDGEVIVYCPSSSMQSKEVDARIEIDEHKVLPLRIQGDDFTCHAEVDLLDNYYKRLWRAYIFVSADIYAGASRSKAVVDAFCLHNKIAPAKSYSKVRGHGFRTEETDTARKEEPRARADISTILDEVTASLGERCRSMTLDELKTAIAGELSRDSRSSTIRKKEPQRTIEFEEELARVLSDVFPGRKVREVIKNWATHDLIRMEPTASGLFLERVRAAADWTPKDLWAARGGNKSSEDGIPAFLDSCLFAINAMGATSEGADGQTEG